MEDNRHPPVCGTGHGTRQWINLEPCGLFCGLVTYMLLGYGMYATTTCVIKPWLGLGLHGTFHSIVFNFLSVLACYSHFAAMTTDPGAVPRECVPLSDDEQENDYESAPPPGGERFRKFCKRCKAFKPLRAHHCSICKRCIIKMDHHCPWVNNCVGIGNHKLFLLFLLWVNVVCAYALVLTICKYMFCKPGLVSDDCGTSTQNLLSVFLLVEASLFGLFTVCMMGDQSSVLTTNQTKIDTLKGVVTNSGVEDFNEVFGCSSDVSFTYDWLVPFRAVFPDHLRDRVLGYHLIQSSSGSTDRNAESYMPLVSNSNHHHPNNEGGLELHDLGAGAASPGGHTEEDLARQRLGSTELWGMNEANIGNGAVPEVPMMNNGRGLGLMDRESVRRRSGPPF